MIAAGLAAQLRDAGVRWDPAAGDRFVVIDPPMPDEVYVVSDMTVDIHRFSSGTVIGFNGTTEWALDSIEHSRALWLPREEQLRTLLGSTFASLTRASDDWVVTTERAEQRSEFSATDAEDAFGAALLALITGS